MITAIVHGGAWDIPVEVEDDTVDACRRALTAGRVLLLDGASALEAVEGMIVILEDEPCLDAGTGSYRNEKGEVEMDAIIVDGKQLRFGSLACLQHCRNPIRVARKLLDITGTCMLEGAGAERFAREQGFEFVHDDLLARKSGSESASGTVGAVVIDAYGDIAAGTSTGGIPRKRAGRIGDSPLIGCGALAENEIGGVSVTGVGEDLMRVQMASMVGRLMAGGRDAAAAAKEAVSQLELRVGGSGGVVCLSASGGIGYAFNTGAMAVGYLDTSGNLCSLVARRPSAEMPIR